MRTPSQNLIRKITPARIGLGFAWIGVLIYASSSAIATLLVDIGAANPVAAGRNAITFTNLLFLGSLISLVPMVVLFRSDWTRTNLRRLSRQDWALLTLSAFLSSALTPGLSFFALEHSSVTNVVLVSRIEPPLFLLAAGLLLKERIDRRALAAGLVALIGALLMILLRETGNLCVLGVGEVAAAAATLSYIASAIVARRALRAIPMGIFSIYRTTVGTVIYFVLIAALKGPQEFQDILSPVLLKWVWVYAIIVFVFGQLAWFFALKYARSGDMALASSFSPVAGIIFAMLLLGEDPGAGLLPGGALILLAICIGQMKTPALPTLTRIWRRRPTFTTSDIAQVLVPVAALPGGSFKGYNGSY
ncbi:DMT family transporter [uncultured Roseovarius sp.]|uniref:DMT family transporter n=1 Tax=uncultured Roseovarius sp. TaxID=293344 RepID=UPI00263A12B9|nr:DMT family transporter [uncultured Roseovarius sp.]